jgi:hypothetical protein
MHCLIPRAVAIANKSSSSSSLLNGTVQEHAMKGIWIMRHISDYTCGGTLMVLVLLLVSYFNHKACHGCVGAVICMNKRTTMIGVVYTVI